MQTEKQTTIRWPAELEEEAKEAARQEDRSLSSLIRQAVREWLDARKTNGNAARG